MSVPRTSPLRLRAPASCRPLTCSLSQAPEVVFVEDDTRPIPWHPHVYSNGIICLDLLDQQGWSPVQSVESICVSLQSMLTGNTKKERPPGDDRFVKHNKKRPRDIRFEFHDNEV